MNKAEIQAAMHNGYLLAMRGKSINEDTLRIKSPEYQEHYSKGYENTLARLAQKGKSLSYQHGVDCARNYIKKLIKTNSFEQIFAYRKDAEMHLEKDFDLTEMSASEKKQFMQGFIKFCDDKIQAYSSSDGEITQRIKLGRKRKGPERVQPDSLTSSVTWMPTETTHDEKSNPPVSQGLKRSHSHIDPKGSDERTKKQARLNVESISPIEESQPQTTIMEPSMALLMPKEERVELPQIPPQQAPMMQVLPQAHIADQSIPHSLHTPVPDQWLMNLQYLYTALQNPALFMSMYPCFQIQPQIASMPMMAPSVSQPMHGAGFFEQQRMLPTSQVSLDFASVVYHPLGSSWIN